MSQAQEIHDSRPPVACDMSGAPDTPAERMAEYGRLFARHLVGCERTDAGLRFSFRADQDVAAWVGDLARREKACCAFFNFTVTADDHEVRWDASVIDDDVARQMLAGFYRLAKSLAGPREGSDPAAGRSC